MDLNLSDTRTYSLKECPNLPWTEQNLNMFCMFTVLPSTYAMSTHLHHPLLCEWGWIAHPVLPEHPAPAILVQCCKLGLSRLTIQSISQDLSASPLCTLWADNAWLQQLSSSLLSLYLPAGTTVPSPLSSCDKIITRHLTDISSDGGWGPNWPWLETLLPYL